MQPDGRAPVLMVQDLVKNYPVRGGKLFRHAVGEVHAVSGVSFSIDAGETLGLVGESGCGKSTTARAVLQLVKPTSGSVRFEDQELTTLGPAEMREVRRYLQVVFQDPYASLDPKLPVGETIAEPLKVHGLWHSRNGRGGSQRRCVRSVSLPRMPGGTRTSSRVASASALGLHARSSWSRICLVLDEPVSALDVSIQAGVVNLLEDLQDKLGLSYLFVAHDLSVVRHISDRVAVMYLGKIVEMGTKEHIYKRAAHPYTQALLSAVPVPDPRAERQRQRQRILLPGDVPSPVNPPSGCRFRTRCWKAQEICAREEPMLNVFDPDHTVACHFASVDPEIIQASIAEGTRVHLRRSLE